MGKCLQSNHSPIWGLNTASSVLSMDWEPCRVDRCCSRSGVGAGNACEIYYHNASFLASASDSDRWHTSMALEKRYRVISVHGIHPLPLEPIQSSLVKSWGPCRLQAL
ncbi:hypothetical protein TNCV_3697581 [Trichonephila clavipes]|uniref:Uncharacterized protein n=1 Tax=Trichonephila clavipes TaxID=2585209 RepID=A0A8X6SCN6_TRICX|nr:hypothetical protein TNCV_3697581 [Trichonephila clavipes]